MLDRIISSRLLAAMLAAILVSTVGSTAFGNDLLDPQSQPKFVNPLPIPARIDATQPGDMFRMQMRETSQWLGLEDGDGNPLMTTVWGYGLQGETATYPGPTFVAMKDVPLSIQWANKLPRYNFPDGPGAHLLPVDPNLHIAHPVRGGIPTVTHLHGGHTESASDGLPEAWFTQNWKETGPHFVKQDYYYDNDQVAATLWYHDHALGITRLNVYAGLAGFYLLRDAHENQLVDDGVLPTGPYEIEVAIQDRMFSGDGSLFFPHEDPEIEDGFLPLPEGPSAIAEFFGDFILVNGVAWPRLNVEPRKYRLRLLNGSDSRFYVLEFRDGQSDGSAIPFYQIGTDVGLLPAPVPLTSLLIAPGERTDLIVDFSGQSEVFLRNFGPDDPFKGFNKDGTLADGEGGVLPPADPATTGQIMKFVVDRPFENQFPEVTVGMGAQLTPDIVPLVQTGATRKLALFEGLDQYGRLQPLLGTLVEGSLAWFEPITENPMVNDVEVWEIYNATEDAHPIHLHLVAFQILDRQRFKGEVEEKKQLQHDGTYGVGGRLTVDALVGKVDPPAPNEDGWKDTVVMLPGTVTRVIASFDREGRYVWHCHILSHEDHEMMRPFQVGPLPAMQPASVSNDREPMAVTGTTLARNTPNPFAVSTTIDFTLPRAERVSIVVYDVQGRRVRTLADRDYPGGTHSVSWNSRDDSGRKVPNGIYFYGLRAGDQVLVRRMLKLW